MIHRIWRLSETSDHNNLGLACTDQGLVLGRTPLIERRDGRFVVRERNEIECLLSHAYRTRFFRRPDHAWTCDRGRRLERERSRFGADRRGAFADSRPARPAPREMPWRRRTFLSNTRATKAAAVAAGIRRCIRAPARRPIPAGLRRPAAMATSHHSTRTAQNDDPTRRSRCREQARARIGSDCDLDRNASTSSRTSPSGSRTRHRRMRRQSARRSKDITRMSAGKRRPTISTPN